MDNNRLLKETKYFELRNSVQKSEQTKEVLLPSHFKDFLPEDKETNILDIGCGFGGMLSQLKNLDYSNLHGIDINDEAIDFCKNKKLDVCKVESIIDYCNNYQGLKYDLIVMTHVIEHISKNEIITTLSSIKKILNNSGKLYITTPNAQSRSGCYWAYEDFTHELVFTSGSLKYVIFAAGFDNVKFVDIDGTKNSRFKLIKKFFLKLYKINSMFWDKVTGAAYHRESENIYTWEIKVLAS